MPDRALVQALENLQNALSYDVDVKTQGDQIAYAIYVLARNRKASISDLRYYADTMINDFPTPLAKAHIAAALALYGDATRSKNIFVDALQMTEDSIVHRVNLSRTDYGSILRDGAAILALAAESRPVPPVIPELAKAVGREWDRSKWTSTQEQAWTLLAARAIQSGDDLLKVDVNGALHTGAYMAKMSGDALMNNPLTLTSAMTDPVSAVVTTVAAPVTPLPAGGNGFAIERTYYTLDGEPVNISEAQQNERYVVVLHVTETNAWPSRVVMTDLLPAGLHIDNPSLVDSAQLTNFDWIGEQTAAHTEFRNDRFVAAFNRTSDDNREINVAYIVRAVTPGVYDHPAATVEEYVPPRIFGSHGDRQDGGCRSTIMRLWRKLTIGTAAGFILAGAVFFALDAADRGLSAAARKDGCGVGRSARCRWSVAARLCDAGRPLASENHGRGCRPAIHAHADRL